MTENFYWRDIDKMEDYLISYNLYRQSLNISQIARIRNESVEKIRIDILNAKSIEKRKRQIEESKCKNKNIDYVKLLLTSDKNNRLDIISKLNDTQLVDLKKDLYEKTIKENNVEDLMVLVWIIGELKDSFFLKILYPLVESKHSNLRRITYSAIGKIGNKSSKQIIEMGLYDNNPQIRQYCAKSLSKIGDLKTVEILENILKYKSGFEKEYVIRACKETISVIK